MAIYQHVGFEPPAWAEFSAGPSATPGYAARVLATGPEAYWRLDDAAGPSATDLTGNHHGQYEGGGQPRAPGPLRYEASAAFDFTLGNVAVADAGTPGLGIGAGEGLTLTAWINPRPDSTNEFRYLIGKGRLTDGGTDQNYGLRIAARFDGTWRLSFIFRDAADANWHRWTGSSSHPSDAFAWVSFAFTFGDPGGIRATVNGEPQAGAWDLGDGSADPLVNDADLWIGSALDRGAGSSFRGRIAEVGLWRRRLTSVETHELYAAGRGL